MDERLPFRGEIEMEENMILVQLLMKRPVNR